MGPIAALWAEAMRDRGHDVEVIAAHPHYPGPLWGQRALPYRERRNGIAVTRLPLLIGHSSTTRRVAEEVTYATSAAAAMVVLGRPDAAVVVSPAFVALGPMILRAKLRRHPWVLWLQDILPDAATTTGLLGMSWAVLAARRLELAAYRFADHIVVPSEAFRRNLATKSIDSTKIDVIPNPATQKIVDRARRRMGGSSPRLVAIGNIGFSQGLSSLVRTLERTHHDFQLQIAGTGELVEELRRELRNGPCADARTRIRGAAPRRARRRRRRRCHATERHRRVQYPLEDGNTDGSRPAGSRLRQPPGPRSRGSCTSRQGGGFATAPTPRSSRRYSAANCRTRRNALDVVRRHSPTLSDTSAQPRSQISSSVSCRAYRDVPGAPFDALSDLCAV